MKFEKISKEQWYKDGKIYFGEINKDKTGFFMNLMDNAKEDYYNELKIPRRATKGSAGYDFYAPFNITIPANGVVQFPTGIKCRINEGYVLMLYPRSGLGFKYGIQLINTVGVIDSDYYNNPKNEGHIGVKLVNPSDVNVEIKQGQAYMQGIIQKFYTTEDDEAKATRTGGFGSTTKEG